MYDRRLTEHVLREVLRGCDLRPVFAVLILQDSLAIAIKNADEHHRPRTMIWAVFSVTFIGLVESVMDGLKTIFLELILNTIEHSKKHAFFVFLHIHLHESVKQDELAEK